MRRKDDALRESLLALSREIADAEGIDAVNIRSIAGRAGVATGTVYNYFANKEEILLALTEEYWRQTLLELEEAVPGGPFCRQLEDIYAFLKERIERSAGRLMNHLGRSGTGGRARMASMQAALEAALIRRLEQDAGVRGDIWTESFTKEQFAHFLMMNMMSSLKAEAPDLSFLIQVVRRIIYERRGAYAPGDCGNHL